MELVEYVLCSEGKLYKSSPFSRAFISTSFFLLLGVIPARSAPAEPQVAQKQDLQFIQEEIRKLESGISSGKQAEATISQELQKLERLLKLQALEIQLSGIELEKMEEKAQEMQVRRDSLEESIQLRKKRLRKILSVLPTLEGKSPMAQLTDDNHVFLFQYKESITKILNYDKAEIQALNKHLVEAEDLNHRLQEEKERILAHTEDLKEKQAILGLNKTLKKDLLKKTRADQQQRLHVYQAAKAAESELESMISKLNLAAEIRLKSETPSELATNTLPRGLNFLSRKGKLPLPTDGAVISNFGRKYDQATSLYTFHKGIDIQTNAGTPVKAIFPGKVVFAGKLGAYGQLLIIDHGEQYYSLTGQLGELAKKEGDSVAEGEILGRSALDNTPLYFEIRQRHVAVNPVPWLAVAAAKQK